MASNDATVTLPCIIILCLQDKCFEERENLNLRIVESINTAAEAWGVQVLRYEIKDITPPPAVKDAMDGQVRPRMMRTRV